MGTQLAYGGSGSAPWDDASADAAAVDGSPTGGGGDSDGEPASDPGLDTNIDSLIDHVIDAIEAAAALGVAPVDCIAIEDSNTGARSAEAAGCTVIVVENHVPVDQGPRRVFLPTLDGLTTGALPTLLP